MSFSEFLSITDIAPLTSPSEIKLTLTFNFFKLLKNFEGFNASINGATQIRAGVLRPEVVIPVNQEQSSSNIKSDEDSVISVGSKVRIIREPYFGKVGTVTDLPFKPIILDTETKARVAEIKLHDGKKYLVPRSNLEVILDY